MDAIGEYEYKNPTFSEFYVFQLIFIKNEKFLKTKLSIKSKDKSFCNLKLPEASSMFWKLHGSAMVVQSQSCISTSFGFTTTSRSSRTLKPLLDLYTSWDHMAL
jgi:hypothetical protein